MDDTSGTGTARRRRQRTVLAVDDSRTNLNVLGHRLGQQGFLALLCDNGSEALDLIASGGIDLVLLDMMMPGISGIQVLKELRAGPDTADLPIIMVTGRSDSEAAVEALAAGADDYVAKPFEFPVLAARIERTLTRAKRMRELKRANAALDARIAQRAIELGEARAELATARADRNRLAASLRALSDRLDASV